MRVSSGVQDLVAAVRSEELWREFERRVVDDRRLIAISNLLEHLPDQR
jgi:hypothetical protein